MWKQLTVQGNTQYLDILPQIFTKFYNKKHLSTYMTPTEARKKNKGTSLSQSQNIKIQEKDIRQRIHSKLDRTNVCDR